MQQTMQYGNVDIAVAVVRSAVWLLPVGKLFYAFFTLFQKKTATVVEITF